MRRRTVIAAIILLVAFVGAGIGEVIFRSAACRDLIGRAFGRGQLVALANGAGIYEADIEREKQADAHLGTVADNEQEGMELSNQRLSRLITEINSRRLASKAAVSKRELERELALLRAQLVDDKGWFAALKRGGYSDHRLADVVRSHLQTRRWLEQQVKGRDAITEEECRDFYGTRRASFDQPTRYRARHLFLAAPPEKPAEVVKEQEEAIRFLKTRLDSGEDFAALIAENSEDEWTKARGGDLGFFSEKRMPADFFGAVARLRPQEFSGVVRCRLGFHLIQLADTRTARQMAFEEVRAEIADAVAQEKRRVSGGALENDLGKAGYLRPLR